MADITDPRVINFTNTSIRPLCEAVRNLKALGDITLLKWQTEIAELTPNDGSFLQDGRDAEGISRLTGADINAVMSVLSELKLSLEANPAIPAIIQKPCVRNLNV